MKTEFYQTWNFSILQSQILNQDEKDFLIDFFEVNNNSFINISLDYFESLSEDYKNSTEEEYIHMGKMLENVSIKLKENYQKQKDLPQDFYQTNINFLFYW